MKRRVVVALLVVCSGVTARARADEPSASTWTLDASAGLPRLRSSGDFNLVGALTAGWTTPRWGAIAWGSAHTFALDSGDTHSDLDAYAGHAEGYMRFGTERDAFEVRLRLGAALYDTTFIQAPAGSVAFQDESSVLYDGALLVGARLHPSDRFAVHALIGGGAYDEEYNGTQVNGGGGTTANGGITDTSRVAGRGEARLELRWATAPGVVSLRLRSEAQLYSLTRSTNVISIVGARVGATSSTDTLTQIETSNRLFVHIDAAAFAGILPAVFAGLDTLSVSVDGASKSDIVPVVGVDLFKPEP